MPNPTNIDSPSSSASKMVNTGAILEAIDDLQSQEAPNINATARKHNVVESTLRRRYNRQTTSHRNAHSENLQLLTDAQEEVLIEYINKLSTRGMHPTPQILDNLVTEIVGHHIGERWVERFCERHKTELKSLYLRGIDQARHIADNSKHFKHYFDTISTQLIKKSKSNGLNL